MVPGYRKSCTDFLGECLFGDGCICKGMYFCLTGLIEITDELYSVVAMLVRVGMIKILTQKFLVWSWVTGLDNIKCAGRYQIFVDRNVNILENTNNADFDPFLGFMVLSPPSSFIQRILPG
jgi:hypothetical protein